MTNFRRAIFLLLPTLVMTQLVYSMSGRVGHLEKLNNMSARDYFADDALVRIAEQIEENTLDQSELADVNLNREGKEGMTLLMWALAKRELSGVSILLSGGANPNVTTSYNAMWMSVIAEDPEYLLLLLEHGGDPNSIDLKTQRTLIFEAALHRRLQNIEALKDAGAEMNQQDLSGNTVLSYAISFKAYDIGLTLLDMGVDPSLEDRWGYDALKMLTQYGDKGVEKGSKTYQNYLSLRQELEERVAAKSS